MKTPINPLADFDVEYYDYDCERPCTQNGCCGHSTDIPLSFTVGGVTFHVDGAQSGDFPDVKENTDRVCVVVKSLGKAVNEHTALVSVAEAAEAINRFLEGSIDYDHAFMSGGNLTPRRKIEAALSNLAAVRAGQPVAAVKYEEAVFNTKEDAEFWITQERRKAGFHVIEAAKATGGFKVVFERRKSSQPETAPVDHLPLVDALMKIASWSEGDEVSGHFDEPSSATIARKALAAVGIMGGVK